MNKLIRLILAVLALPIVVIVQGLGCWALWLIEFVGIDGDIQDDGPPIIAGPGGDFTRIELWRE